MKKISSKRPCSLLFIFALFLSLLSGCGEQSSDSSNQTSQKASNVKLTIVNEQGVEILQGDLVVQDTNKKEILKTKLDGSSPYKLAIKAGAAYPLLISVTPDLDVYGKNSVTLKAILASPLAEKLRISFKSTSAIDYINSQLGGVFSKENISKAALATMTPDFRPARSYKGGMAKISGK